MPDPTIDPKVGAVVQDALDDATLAKALVAAFKSGGLKAALPMAPSVVTTVQRDVADVAAALPAIKAGYKTTEFWITVGGIVLVGAVPMFTGKPLPFDSVTVIGALSAVYAIVRGLTKSSAATASAK